MCSLSIFPSSSLAHVLKRALLLCTNWLTSLDPQHRVTLKPFLVTINIISEALLWHFIICIEKLFFIFIKFWGVNKPSLPLISLRGSRALIIPYSLLGRRFKNRTGLKWSHRHHLSVLLSSTGMTGVCFRAAYLVSTQTLKKLENRDLIYKIAPSAWHIRMEGKEIVAPRFNMSGVMSGHWRNKVFSEKKLG